MTYWFLTYRFTHIVIVMTTISSLDFLNVIFFFCHIQSLWNKFFQDKELKGMVKQDVLRT